MKVRLGIARLFHKCFLLPILTFKRKLLHVSFHISIRDCILYSLGGDSLGANTLRHSLIPASSMGEKCHSLSHV